MRDSDSGPVVSLFSGAGGCSAGFASLGLKPAFAADNDVDAAATYSENLGTTCEVLDLSLPSAADEVLKALNGIAPLFIVGGPPCQGFSTAGPRRADDPRNRLIFNYLEIVQRARPRWFLFENVEGILTSNGGRDVAALVEALAKLGYVVRLEKLNFAAYGIPQTRKRVIIVGNRIGLDFWLPEGEFAYDSGKSKLLSTKQRAPSILQAIEDLPAPRSDDGFIPYEQGTEREFNREMRGAAAGVRHHLTKVPKEIAAVAHLIGPGQTMKDLPKDLQHRSYQRRANRRVADGMPTEKRGGAPAGFKRLDASLNSLTITSASTREFIHPTSDRTLTLRECARLQTFPDSFVFAGNHASIAKQIGNAIPPMAAKRIASSLLAQDAAAGAETGSSKSVPPGLLSFRLTDSTGMSPALVQTNNLLTGLQRDSLPLLRKIANG